MGYVRMIRSGGLHFVSNSIRFIPDLDDIPNFEQLSRDEKMSDEAVEAAKLLDEVVENLRKNFAEGTEYFEVKYCDEIFLKSIFYFLNFTVACVGV